MNYCKCNCGQTVKKNWATGHHRLGTTFALSEEAKDKIRQSQLGTNNSMFGKTSWNKGKKMSEETKQKVRQARARQVFTPEQNKATSLRIIQEWKDGRRKREALSWYIDGRHAANKSIKQSFEYKWWRREVFRRDNYSCQECGIRGGELQAHHIKAQSLHPELRFNIDNGQTLCRSCHMKTDTWGMRMDLMKKVGTQS